MPSAVHLTLCYMCAFPPSILCGLQNTCNLYDDHAFCIQYCLPNLLHPKKIAAKGYILHPICAYTSGIDPVGALGYVLYTVLYCRVTVSVHCIYCVVGYRTEMVTLYIRLD